VENGAIRALAQDLVGSTGMLDGGEPGGIRIHAGASSAALMRMVRTFSLQTMQKSIDG